MIRSTHRHPVAVLRILLGLDQQDFAKLIGCSVSTVQSIELGPGRMPLSPEMAMLITDKTGIDPDWLMAGDPSATPVGVNGKPYTGHLSTFQKMGALGIRRKAIEELREQMESVLSKASAEGCAWRATFLIKNALKEIESQIDAPPR
jgi:transcriptional regulator with XRE-family HTH domain